MDDQPKKKNGFLRALKIVILSILVITLCLAGFGFAYMLGMDAQAKLDPQKILGVDQSTTIYDTNGEIMSTVHGLENRTWVDINTLPDHVKLAFVSAEDARFYSHSGVDVKRIFGALWADIKAGSAVEGASTITQQLIKNSHLNPEKTISRKIEEALMALELERRYSKDEILEMYLNYIYFGAGAYGVEAAAQTYFSVDAKELSLAQAATLAGILKSPTKFAPHLKPENSQGRRDVVLDLMAEYGFATAEAAAKAKEQPLALDMREKNNEFGWYIDLALEIAAEKTSLDYDDLITGGYKVFTAMDPTIQRLCNEAYKNPELFPENAEDGSQPQSAIVIMSPDNGHVVAMVGGREYTVQRGLNRVTQLKRQPGSTIKPLMVYAPALKSGMYISASLFMDEPKTYETPNEVYKPKNFGNQYYGEVTLRTAVVKSLNTPAVEILNEIGVREGKRFAQSAGIEFDAGDNGLSLALGGFSKGVSPLELCAGYNSFAAGGEYNEPVIVTRVENAAGEVLYAANDSSKNIMDAGDCFILTDMLRDVVSVGTGRRLGGDIPLAGKTGTNDYEGIGNRDAWMAAYNSEYSAVVWMGYDTTNETHHLPNGCTGGTFPTQLLKEVFDGIYSDREAPEFSHPSNVELVRLDKEALRNGRLELAQEGAGEDSYVEDYLRSGQVPPEPTPKPTPQPVRFSLYDFDAWLNELLQPEISFKTSSSLGSYGIYRIDDSKETTMVARLSGKTAYTWLDTTAEMGQGYTYFAAALDENGHAGKQSNKVFILVTPSNAAASPGQNETPITPTGEQPSQTPAGSQPQESPSGSAGSSGNNEDDTGLDDILDGYEDKITPEVI